MQQQQMQQQQMQQQQMQNNSHYYQQNNISNMQQFDDMGFLNKTHQHKINKKKNIQNNFVNETYERSHIVNMNKEYRPRMNNSNKIQEVPTFTQMQEKYQDLQDERGTFNNPLPNLDNNMNNNQLYKINSSCLESDPSQAVIDFRNNEQLRETNFKKQEELRRKEFYNSQKKRRSAFKNEINNFENSKFNPYKILGIGKTDDMNIIRRAYKKMALNSHPDRGGSNEHFQNITKAYMYLMEKIKENANNHQYHEMKDNAQDFYKKQENDNKQNKKFDKDNFNIKIFNKIYEENRLDDPYDDGYGTLMEERRPRDSYCANDIEIPNIFSDKFNTNVFNTVFNSMKDNQSVEDNKELTQFNGPAAIFNQSDCMELGQGKIADFSSSDNNSLQYTDYMKAHTQPLINPNSVQTRGDFKSIEDLERHRENIKYTMSPEEIARQNIQSEKDKQNEVKRLSRLKEYDNSVSTQYSKINQQFIDRF